MNHGRLLAKRCITEVRLFIPPYTSVTKRITIIDLSPKKDMFIFIFIWRERERETETIGSLYLRPTRVFFLCHRNHRWFLPKMRSQSVHFLCNLCTDCATQGDHLLGLLRAWPRGDGLAPRGAGEVTPGKKRSLLKQQRFNDQRSVILEGS